MKSKCAGCSDTSHASIGNVTAKTSINTPWLSAHKNGTAMQWWALLSFPRNYWYPAIHGNSFWNNKPCQTQLVRHEYSAPSSQACQSDLSERSQELSECRPWPWPLPSTGQCKIQLSHPGYITGTNAFILKAHLLANQDRFANSGHWNPRQTIRTTPTQAASTDHVIITNEYKSWQIMTNHWPHFSSSLSLHDTVATVALSPAHQWGPSAQGTSASCSSQTLKRPITREQTYPKLFSFANQCKSYQDYKEIYHNLSICKNCSLVKLHQEVSSHQSMQ